MLVIYNAIISSDEGFNGTFQLSCIAKKEGICYSYSKFIQEVVKVSSTVVRPDHLSDTSTSSLAYNAGPSLVSPLLGFFCFPQDQHCGVATLTPFSSSQHPSKFMKMTPSKSELGKTKSKILPLEWVGKLTT